MLRRITPSPIDDNENKENSMELITHKKITSIEKKHFFHKGLEYASPARGHWNIVHIGMLVPGCHQIYIGGLGCIYGVVLTAAEMNAMVIPQHKIAEISGRKVLSRIDAAEEIDIVKHSFVCDILQIPLQVGLILRRVKHHI